MQVDTPPQGTGQVYRNPENEDTAVLTPVVDGSDARERTPVSRKSPRSRRRRSILQQRIWIGVASVLTVLLVIAVAMISHMVTVTAEWEERAQALEDVSRELGRNLTAEQEAVLEQQAQIELITEQLDTNIQRVLDLANQINQSGDAAVVTQQRLDNLNAMLNSASSVSNALNRCVDSQNQLADYLRDAENYTEEELIAYEESVDDMCDAAIEANAQLQRALVE